MPTNFNRIISETPKDVELFVSRSMDILERLHELLNEKFDGKQKLLAEKLGKTEAEISKMTSGVQNFTLKTLCKLEAAFGEPIIAVATNSINFDVVAVKCTPKPSRVQFSINTEGGLIEEFANVNVSDKPIEHSQNTSLA